MSATPAERDPYAVLGLPPTASRAEVGRAVRRLLRRHHPDVRLPGGLSASADDDAIRAVLQAYDRILRSRQAAMDGSADDGAGDAPTRPARRPAGGSAGADTSPDRGAGSEPLRHHATAGPAAPPAGEPPIRVTPVRWHRRD